MTRRDIITAVPVGFRADGSFDEDGTRKILRYIAGSGNEGVLVLGTTGEFPALDEGEFSTIVKTALEELGDVMRVIVHVGRSSAYEALRRVEIARELGATEFAALTPYYLVSSEEAIYDYFAALSAAVGDNALYVYHYPKRSGNAVSPELMARLAALPAIVGAKISEMSLEELAAYRAVVSADFILYTGADRELLAAGEAGAQGVVSGVSSVLPGPFRALVAAAESGDGAAIAAAQAAVDDACAVIGGDMARMKAAYRHMGVADVYCRMALTEPDEAARAEVERVCAQYR